MIKIPMHEEMLTYGLKRGTKNVLLHIDEVSNGLSCDCECPNCHHPLIARNGGKKKEHHFAHASGADCGKARMTALHILAQNVLAQRKTILLPPYYKTFVHKGAKVKVFKDVKLEEFSKVENVSLRPDCNCIPEKSDVPSLWVEIYCRHKVEDPKEREIRKREQYCIEVDFRDLLTKDYSEEDVIRRFEEDSEQKEWICCPIWDKEEEEKQKQKEEADRLKREEKEKLETERLKREQKDKDRKNYLEQLTTEWKFFATQQNTDKIINEIERGQNEQGNKSLPQIIDFLIPDKQWRRATLKFPRNLFGLQVFYYLLKYYKVFEITSEYEQLMWRTLEDETLSPEFQILEEYRMALCVLCALYTQRPFTNENDTLAQKFVENEIIRKEIYRILRTGKERSCFNSIDVRNKVEDYYKHKHYGDDILRIFKICFPESEIKKQAVSKYAESFDLTKEKPVASPLLFE